jgi:HmuY protein
MLRTLGLVSTLLLVSASCKPDAAADGHADARALPGDDAAAPHRDGGAGAVVDAAYDLPGETWSFEVPAKGRVGLKLQDLTFTADAARDSLAWDLAFEGFAVLTNSGPSGNGNARATGPIDAINLIFDDAPPVPLFADRPFGALSDWYQFGQSGVESRLHVYAVRSGDKLWKLQILGYHGTGDGGTASGLYQLRFAEVTPTSSDEPQRVVDLDATAGGVSPLPNAPGTCLNLETGTQLSLSPREWPTRTDWHLCFRRTEVVANGGYSGALGVTVADLDADATFEEDVARTLDADAETKRFETLGYDALVDPSLEFRADDATQAAIGYNWLERTGPNAEPSPGVWLVQNAEGTRQFLVMFTALAGSTEQTPGTVSVRVKEVAPLEGTATHP